MDFFDKLKTLMGKTANVSKNAFEKAGSAVQDFSDKSVLKIEIKQLESKKNQDYTKLGKVVSDIYISGAETISSENEEIKAIVGDIKTIDAEIEKKKAELPAE